MFLTLQLVCISSYSNSLTYCLYHIISDLLDQSLYWYICVCMCHTYTHRYVPLEIYVVWILILLYQLKVLFVHLVSSMGKRGPCSGPWRALFSPSVAVCLSLGQESKGLSGCASPTYRLCCGYLGPEIPCPNNLEPLKEAGFAFPSANGAACKVHS